MLEFNLFLAKFFVCTNRYDGVFIIVAVLVLVVTHVPEVTLALQPQTPSNQEYHNSPRNSDDQQGSQDQTQYEGVPCGLFRFCITEHPAGGVHHLGFALVRLANDHFALPAHQFREVHHVDQPFLQLKAGRQRFRDHAVASLHQKPHFGVLAELPQPLVDLAPAGLVEGVVVDGEHPLQGQQEAEGALVSVIDLVTDEGEELDCIGIRWQFEEAAVEVCYDVGVDDDPVPAGEGEGGGTEVADLVVGDDGVGHGAVYGAALYVCYPEIGGRRSENDQNRNE